MADSPGRSPAGDYPILPAANRHWLTPFYDLGCELMGLGRSFQRDVLAQLRLSGKEHLLDVGCGSGTWLRASEPTWLSPSESRW